MTIELDTFKITPAILFDQSSGTYGISMATQMKIVELTSNKKSSGAIFSKGSSQLMRVSHNLSILQKNRKKNVLTTYYLDFRSRINSREMRILHIFH